MAKVNPYNKLSIGAKMQRDRDRMAEPAIACPLCETKTSVDGLLDHLRGRCPGKRAIHDRSKWVTRAEALAMGLTESTLKRWLHRGRIRVRAARGERTGPGRPSRQYLARDIVKLLAARWIWTTTDSELDK